MFHLAKLAIIFVVCLQLVIIEGRVRGSGGLVNRQTESEDRTERPDFKINDPTDSERIAGRPNVGVIGQIESEDRTERPDFKNKDRTDSERITGRPNVGVIGQIDSEDRTERPDFKNYSRTDSERINGRRNVGGQIESEEPIIDSEKHSNIIYSGFDPSDVYGNTGIHFSDIIEYAFGVMNIKVKPNISSQNKPTFDSYVEKLGKKLGGGEPYQRNKKVDNVPSTFVLYDMMDVIPLQNGEIPEQFIDSVKSAVKRSACYNELKLTTAWFKRGNTNEIDIKDFAIMRVMKQGKELYLIPCYFKLDCKRMVEYNNHSNLPTTWNEVEFNYFQVKFTLTKYDINSIIQKLNSNF